MASQITVESKTQESIQKYEAGITKMFGASRLLPIDVNLSKPDYRVTDVNGKPAIRRGFKGVEKCRGRVGTDITAGQPYKDMFDYCRRAGTGSGKACVEVLIDNGGFNWLLPKIKTKGGAPATKSDLHLEYNKQIKFANAEKKVSGARKQEAEGIDPIFSFEEEEVHKNFVLSV